MYTLLTGRYLLIYIIYTWTPSQQLITHFTVHLIITLSIFFAGREQVSAGITPINLAIESGKGTSSSQSALAVFPIAIANCAEKR